MQPSNPNTAYVLVLCPYWMSFFRPKGEKTTSKELSIVGKRNSYRYYYKGSQVIDYNLDTFVASGKQ